MPTTNPRIALTLSQHRYDVLKRLAQLQGCSMASIVGELLETCEPMLERMCDAIEAVKAAPENMHAGLRQALLDVEQQMMPHLEGLAAVADGVLEAAENAAPIGEARARSPRPQRSEDGRTRASGSNPGNRNHPGQVSTECTRKSTTSPRKSATSKGKK